MLLGRRDLWTQTLNASSLISFGGKRRTRRYNIEKQQRRRRQHTRKAIFVELAVNWSFEFPIGLVSNFEFRWENNLSLQIGRKNIKYRQGKGGETRTFEHVFKVGTSIDFFCVCKEVKTVSSSSFLKLFFFLFCSREGCLHVLYGGSLLLLSQQRGSVAGGVYKHYIIFVHRRELNWQKRG